MRQLLLLCVCVGGVETHAPVLQHQRCLARPAFPSISTPCFLNLPPSLCTGNRIAAGTQTRTHAPAHTCFFPCALQYTHTQGTLLLFGAGTSGALSRKLAAAPWSAFLPQLAGISLLTAELWALLLP